MKNGRTAKPRDNHSTIKGYHSAFLCESIVTWVSFLTLCCTVMLIARYVAHADLVIIVLPVFQFGSMCSTYIGLLSVTLQIHEK